MPDSTSSRKSRHSGKPLQKTTRPPLERIGRIHNAVAARKFPNCTTLARELEVSTKTVARDLEFMQTRLQLPLEYNAAKRGYEYTGKVDGLPMFRVTEWELLALFVAQKVMAQFNDTAFEKVIGQSLQNIAGGSGDNGQTPFTGTGDVISFKASGTANVDLELFFKLHGAILEGREIEFRYRRRGARTHEPRSLQPYFIHGALNAWYLIGFDSRKKDFRVFAVHRVSELTVKPERFQRNKNVTLESLLENSLSVYVSDERFNIRLRFDAFAADLIRERHWHASQKFEELPNGGVILQMTLNSLFEVEQWVLGWGSHAEVLEPLELRQRLANHAREMMKTYS